jgi:hypothetical protein
MGGISVTEKETTTNRCLVRLLCRLTDRDRRILRSSLTPSKEKHTQIPLGFYLRSVETLMSHGCLANIMYTCLDSDRSLWRSLPHDTPLNVLFNEHSNTVYLYKYMI